MNLAQKSFPMTVRPYKWNGPYARWRADAPHDPGLCADLRGGWLGADERLILRTCEVMGHPHAFSMTIIFLQPSNQDAAKTIATYRLPGMQIVRLNTYRLIAPSPISAGLDSNLRQMRIPSISISA